ncbi:MAG: amidohydrolase [Actinobacteria bacterium 69-20]|jgi:predicted amidohydrolase YtcJ|nr:amidohydrolase [Actinomycetota bacterium]OJV23580.1 MAG: amidohydrolase [Actinobacteria bacterium 69-20]
MGHPELEIAFVQGAIFDGVTPRAVRTDVGVAGGRITALGYDAVRAGIGAGTRVIDLADRLLLPGFNDAHVHPTEGGVERLGCDLSAARDRAGYLDTVRSYADSHPGAPWIVGGGWAQAAFLAARPDRRDLDGVCADRPVVLANRDHHAVWANTRALDVAGIDSGTPDPADGHIEREADGTPSGVLHEGAQQLLLRLAPPPSLDDLYAGFLEAQRYLHSVGITGWQDALIGDYGNHSSRELEVYQRAIRRGDLTARVNGALWWDRDRGSEQIADLVALRERYRHDLFRATTVKIMQDGVPENRTAAMIDPYLEPESGLPGTHRGRSFLDPARLAEYVTELDAADFQVHFHAIGDRAVRECLDAVQAARRTNGNGGATHHIAHLQVVHPDDVPRFGALRVAANIQPLWAAYDPQMTDLDIPLLGAERAAQQYPFTSLAAQGADLCAGSDWPVTSADPWAGIHVAVNRQHPAGTADWHPDVFLPNQRLTLAQALAAYTSGSARINGRHRETGAIRLGYAADLTIADRNPFDLPSEEIGTIRTEQTFFAGRSVYRRETARV